MRPNWKRVVLLGCCPACGNSSIFNGLLTMVTQCAACGLHVGAREQGDGPAFFGIVIIGALATIGAATMEILYTPAYWLHAAVWIPFILFGSLLCLRFAKAGLLAIQYATRPSDFN